MLISSEQCLFIKKHHRRDIHGLKVPLDDVIYFEAEDGYVNVIFYKNKLVDTVIITSTLKKLSLLSSFTRIHRKYLINDKYLCTIKTTSYCGKGQYINNYSLMSSGERLPISRRYRAQVRRKFYQKAIIQKAHHVS